MFTESPSPLLTPGTSSPSLANESHPVLDVELLSVRGLRKTVLERTADKLIMDKRERHEEKMALVREKLALGKEKMAIAREKIALGKEKLDVLKNIEKVIKQNFQ